MPVFLPQEPEYALHTQALLCWYANKYATLYL